MDGSSQRLSFVWSRTPRQHAVILIVTLQAVWFCGFILKSYFSSEGTRDFEKRQVRPRCTHIRWYVRHGGLTAAAHLYGRKRIQLLSHLRRSRHNNDLFLAPDCLENEAFGRNGKKRRQTKVLKISPLNSVKKMVAPMIPQHVSACPAATWMLTEDEPPPPHTTDGILHWHWRRWPRSCKFQWSSRAASAREITCHAVCGTLYFCFKNSRRWIKFTWICSNRPHYCLGGENKAGGLGFVRLYGVLGNNVARVPAKLASGSPKKRARRNLCTQRCFPDICRCTCDCRK